MDRWGFSLLCRESHVNSISHNENVFLSRQQTLELLKDIKIVGIFLTASLWEILSSWVSELFSHRPSLQPLFSEALSISPHCSQNGLISLIWFRWGISSSQNIYSSSLSSRRPLRFVQLQKIDIFFRLPDINIILQIVISRSEDFVLRRHSVFFP